MDPAADTEIVLFAAGLIFLWALVLGVWKYRAMAGSPDGLAHPYIDTAHRAALLYSFATLLLSVFVELSAWSQTVDLIAAGAVVFFFVSAIAGYCVQGVRKRTDNQIRDAIPGTHAYMWGLIAAEIGGTLVLLAGFADARLF